MKRMRLLGRFLLYTSGASSVLILYLIIPSIITLNAIFPGSRVGLAIGFGLFILAEVAVFAVLLSTTGRRAARPMRQERRLSSRRPANYTVELRRADAGALLGAQPIRARAINASATGLAVLVEPDAWADGNGRSAVWVRLPGHTDLLEAETLDAAPVVVDRQRHCLVRLRLADRNGDTEDNGRGDGHERAHNGTGFAGNTWSTPIRLDAKVSARGWAAALVIGCRQGIRRLAALLPMPLWIILAVQTVASESQRNTAFQDEALYLYAGRQIVHHLLGGPAPTEHVGDFLAGTIIYPVIGGALDLIGGLEAARFYSLLWMLGATVAIYVVAKSLYDRTSALLAAALFAIEGSTLFIGHFATYDAMSLGLLSLATVLAVQAATARTPWLSALVPVVLMLAVASKYVAILYAPTVLAVLLWKSYQARGGWQALQRTGIALAVLLVTALLGVLRYPASVNAFNASALHRVAAVPASTSVLVQLVIYLAGIIIGLAVLGLFLSRRAYILLGLLLLVSALLAPLYHIYEGEFASLQKHVAFGSFFVAPLAGYAVARLGGRRNLIGLVLCLLIFVTGYQADARLADWWPNSSSMIAVLRTQVHSGDRILAEEHEVVEYYLARYETDLGRLHWSQTYNFEYTDATGRFYQGIPAYKAAIAAGYFDLVVLRYGPTVQTDRAIDGGLRDGTQYELVAKIPYDTAFGASNYWIWRKKAPSPTPAGHLVTQGRTSLSTLQVPPRLRRGSSISSTRGAIMCLGARNSCAKADNGTGIRALSAHSNRPATPDSPPM
ncbi:MAG TPA: glycosyltransferase family 39 protein [Chloroflexota bacterium]|nr:glycosyltransferase family 39 protein [Chloroflexota bacterium]